MQINNYQYSDFDIDVLSSNYDGSGWNLVSLSDESSDLTKQSHINKMLSAYSLLNFKHDGVLGICNDVIIAACNSGKDDIVISRTGEGEILIYRRQANGDINNIIIDRDADIEFMTIPINRRNTQNEYYDFSEVNEKIINDLVTRL